jgi:hypothetical protein
MKRQSVVNVECPYSLMIQSTLKGKRSIAVKAVSKKLKGRMEMMNSEDQFLIINGRRYRKPKFIPYDKKTFEMMKRLGLNFLEASHNYSSAIAKLKGFERDQRFTHSMPEALLWLLEIGDEGSSIVASIAFLELHGFIVTEIDD